MDEEKQIREDYFQKGLGYRELAKKHRKSFRDLARIIKGEEKGGAMELSTMELIVCVKKDLENDEDDGVLTYNLRELIKFFDGHTDISEDTWWHNVFYEILEYLADYGMSMRHEDLRAVLKGKLPFLCAKWYKR